MEPKPSMPNLEVVKSQDTYKPRDDVERASFSREKGVEDVVETASGAIPPSMAPTPSLPVPVQNDISTAMTKVVDDSPLVAGDDDLIEKEWVDKAKSIVATTKDDPYRREQEVSRLQADYLRKRYGKELGAPQ